MAEERTGVAYIRVSKVGGRGDDLISPEVQRHTIDMLAEREGIQIVAEIQDIDKSGRYFAKRRVKEVIQGVKEGRWSYVILWKWSRWGRNLKESQIHLAAVEEVGGIVRAATEDVDPKTTIGRFTRDQLLSIAQLQSDMISDSWKEAQDKRRRDGLPTDGKPRWGYIYEGKRYRVDESLRETLKTAYEAYVSGASLRGMALEWNAAGLRTTTGILWNGNRLGHMLDTGFAAGWIRERSDTAAAGKYTIAHFDVWRRGAHEPIISLELFERYRERRAAQAKMAPRLRTASHALSGLMFCGYPDCGGAMVSTKSGRGRVLNWTCNRAEVSKAHAPNNVSDLRAMRFILGWIERHVQRGESVTEEARRLEAGRRATDDVEALEADINRLMRKRARLADSWTDELIDREDYVRQRAEIAAALAAAEAGKRLAEKRVAASGITYVRQFGALLDEWDRFTAHDKREALAAVFRRMVVHPGPFGPGKVELVPLWQAD
ncbi:recombinase family protein [Actinoplanes sp. CA-252034]|uniref:recombinase family protein n=1 Tax=Actinoplanes sp. CA-252034 TaxID=3239906 RepID=UPI003D96C65C